MRKRAAAALTALALFAAGMLAATQAKPEAVVAVFGGLSDAQTSEDQTFRLSTVPDSHTAAVPALDALEPASELPRPEQTPFATEIAGQETATQTSYPVSTDLPSFSLEWIARETAQADGKRVLIYHTHTYEAYLKGDADYSETERWRTADNRYNVCRVGEELAVLLEALGMRVTHDTSDYERPNLNAAYQRSLEMLGSRASAGERYDLYIDLHRDAYSDSAGGNTVSIGGIQVARLMLLVGKGEGQTGAGFDVKPNWQANLQAAQSITELLNRQFDGLCKEVRIKSGRFNQHVADCCVLIEVGNNRNSLSEALAAMPYLADAIGETLQ